ncbi:MAG: adenylate/guanylate cyclase domain-containing protein [Hyphomicrobiaceae bacterium]
MGTTSGLRRLAAIVAADVAGFSRLVAYDEEGTLEALRSYRTEFIDPQVKKFGGRIANTAGDSLLIEFPSVVEAVRCSLAIQAGIAERNEGLSRREKIAFRIGINVGDVIEHDGDILGDGVNVAARLEGLADPGGICLARAARDQIRDKIEIDLEDLGNIEVKNIRRPVRVFKVKKSPDSNPANQSQLTGNRLHKVFLSATAILLAAVATGLFWMYVWPNRSHETFDAIELPQLSANLPSIAVLPFANMSEDKAQEYFSDGISEDIIIGLSKISGLIVVARNSTFSYKGKRTSTEQIARELSVGHLLEGSVRRAGDRVRITAQLVDASTGNQIWGERYDRPLTDVFAVQDEVAAKIVSQLAIKLTADETNQLQRRMTVDPDAYDMLLRGIEALRRYSRETNKEALAYFEKAVAIEPNYARAHANIGYVHALDIFNGYATDRGRAIDLANKSLERAEQADPTVPQIYMARSTLLRAIRRYEESLADAHKFVQLEPGSDDGYVALGLTLNYVGRHKEALEAANIALRLNPVASVFHYFAQGMALFHLERFEEAAAALTKIIERNPSFLRGHLLLAAAYGHLGRIDDAEWEAAEAASLLPGLSISQQASLVPYKRQEDVDRYLNGLKKAGIRE